MWETIIFIIIIFIVGIILCCIVFGGSVGSTKNRSAENSSPANTTPKTPLQSGLWEKEKRLLIETAIKCGFPKSVVETVEIEGMLKSKHLLVYKCRDEVYPRFYLIRSGEGCRFFYLKVNANDMYLQEYSAGVCVRSVKMLSLEQAIANVREICAKEQEEKKQKETVTSLNEEKQNEKEQEQMKFPKLEELRGYLSTKNTVRPLVVSHKKYGAGRTVGLMNNGTTETLTVTFMQIGGETFVNKDFRFPDCFLQDWLHLEEGWQKIVEGALAKPGPTPPPPVIELKGEKVEQEDLVQLKQYLSLKNTPDLLSVYIMEDDQCRAQGVVIGFDGKKIQLRCQNIYKEFDYPTDFLNGTLRLKEGAKEKIKQFLKIHAPTPPVQPDPKPRPNEKFITGKKILAATHAEFLNKMFGTNFKKWMKSVWWFSSNCLVWMVRINGQERDGWINIWEQTTLPNTIVEETYVGKNLFKIRPPETDYRIVAEILEGDGAPRRYLLRGLFKYDKARSSDSLHYYEKVSDYLP